MGCGLSKQDEEEDVVSLCRERKKLLKLAVERRYAFADAQFKYNQSLYAVAMALRLFVARHSSPSSPFLLTFPSGDNANETHITNPMFLQHMPAEPTHETIACHPSKSDRKVEETHENNKKDEDDEEEEEDSEEEENCGDGKELCEHFYGEDGPPPVSSPQREFGWDFFYPFDEMRTEMLNGFSQSSYEDLKAVREKEGIPELEDEVKEGMSDDKAVNVKNGDVGHKENGIRDVRIGDDSNLGQEESSTKGRELLEALKDIEDHFLRACDSGLDISRMLEANRVQLQSGLEEIKENSNKLIRSISLHHSTSSRSSSCKSLLTSSSVNSSMWTDFKGDPFDENGMAAGSHSLTLGRLYAWEKKLYQEVKAGDQTRKIYERKSSHLKKLNAKGEGFCTMDKSSTEIKELHSRISVAIKSVESISNRIEKLRDEELQPQFLELLQALMKNWKIMLESHETQKRVTLEVTLFNGPVYGRFCDDSHRLATLQIEAELDNWRACFAAYVSTQKSYIEALSSWLSKFIAPEVEFYSRGVSSLPPCKTIGPPLLITCQAWLAWLDKLPDRAVTYAMKSFGKDIHAMWSQQGKEQHQKRKVDGLSKELDRRNLAFQRAERRILGSKISELESLATIQNRMEYLAEGKKLLDMFNKMLDDQKEKHIDTVQETQQIILSGFQTGFAAVFQSLAEFSKASAEMYADLVTYSANANTAEKNDTNLSYLNQWM